MKTELYTIRTLTNLHVGSGEINFDIIDNQVQRDHLGRPHINSSSLKGALREHFSKSDSVNGRPTSYIFGPKNSDNTAQTGAYKFFEASLLTRPVRSNVKPYFNAITPETIEELQALFEDFDIVIDACIKETLSSMIATKPEEGQAFIYEASTGAKIEHIHNIETKTVDISTVEELLGANIALVHYKDMQKIALPVLARNYLISGESKNLWYEEVVPKQSKFYFVLGKPENEDAKDAQELQKFEKNFSESLDDKVQIGANATIGYGYTQIKRVAS